MVRLTEEMVVARTRISDLTAVKKLNCWGTELTDVSILRDLKKVEMLALSVNNIDTLADFQYCLNLRDLFVRKNNIKDLNEVCYLQNLPNLRNLWLDENPCSERDGYRLAVLRALPNLEKLDDKIVSTEEVQNAAARGRILVHPLDMDASPTCSDTPSPQELGGEYIDEGEIDQRRRYSCSIDQQQQQQHQQQQQGYAARGNHRSTEDFQETDRRNANWNASPNFQHNYPQNNHYSYENGTSRGDNNADAALTRSESRSILDNLTPTTNTHGIFKEYDDQVLAGETERTRRRRRHSSSNGEDTYEDNPRRAVFSHNDAVENDASSQRSNLGQVESASTNIISPRTSYPPGDYSDERRSGERRDVNYENQHDERRLNLLESEESMRRSSTAPTVAYHHHTPVDRDEAASREREMATAAAAAAQGWVRHSEKDKCRFHYHRRPVTRNSNILSAVLCLVKELDYPSLEVVEMAVRNRMDELEE